jgi:hypothetical protein
MKQIKITIDVKGAAFDEGNLTNELSRILQELTNNVKMSHLPATLNDINGNKVGKVEFEY